MKINKITTLALSLVLLGSTAVFAADKKSNTVTITVIELAGDPNGSQDKSLNDGLKRYMSNDGKESLDLKVVTVDRKKALKDPKYKGLKMDYMPLYLMEKNKFTEEKFADAIKYGQLQDTDKFIIFEKQTSNWVDVNKKPVKNQLELFVMSQCPYGVQAENKVIDAMKQGKWPKNVDLKIHYIASGDVANGLSSMHGSGEWEEDVRQLIIKKFYPEKFWKYLELRNKDYHSSLWNDVAEQAGIDPSVFKKHWKEGMKMLEEDVKYANENNVHSSPTVIWEGRVKTNMGALQTIPGFEKLAEVSTDKNAAAQPTGSC